MLELSLFVQNIYVSLDKSEARLPDVQAWVTQ
jgi:hypothetical protein